MSENPKCPLCGSEMKIRTARRGRFAGKQFWGCSSYPDCKGTRELEESIPQENPVSSLLNLFSGSIWQNPQGFLDAERIFVPCGASRKPDGNPLTRSWNHLCLCMPQELVKPPLSNEILTTLHVIRKILGRGMAPPLPSTITEQLPSYDGEPPDYQEPSVVFGSPNSDDPVTLMLRKIIPKRLRPDQRSFTYFGIPAAMIPGLSEITVHITCDFVFFHPAHETAAVIVLITDDPGKNQPAESSLQILRDSAKQARHTLFEIPASEIRSGKGLKLDELFHDLWSYPSMPSWDPYPTVVAHTMAALTESIDTGLLTPGAESWDIIPDGPYSDEIVLGIHAFEELARAMGELYDVKILPEEINIHKKNTNLPVENTILLNWSVNEPWYNRIDHKQEGSASFMHMRPCWLPTISSLDPPPREWVEPNVAISHEQLINLLKFVFPDKNDFWEGQEEGIRRCLSGEDSLVLLPTGAGKSLIYQFSAFIMPGFSLVVDPLISLMEDQVYNLKAAGIDRAVNISSTITKMGRSAEVRSLLKAGAFNLCFISPERLQIKSFRDDLASVTDQMPIPLVVIDEAHCVSEWGHDFRPAYLNLARNGRNLGRRGKGQKPTLVGLTGTASRSVLRDLQNELNITDITAVITPSSFDRPELTFEVFHHDSLQKGAAIEGILRGLPASLRIRPGDLFAQRGSSTCSGIVFCPHVKGNYGVQYVSSLLSDKFKIEVPSYSGKDMDEYSKSITAQRFKENKVPLMVATKAFGMGIDKPNIRYTIHYGLPSSLEAFYQEAGRAGRDKKHAHCTLIVSVENSTQAEDLLDPSNDIDRLLEVYRKIPRDKQDDIVRILYFHTESFQGVKTELEGIKAVMNQLGPLRHEGKDDLPFTGKNGSKDLEKAIHRLILLGIVADYTVDFSNKKIEIVRNGVTSSDMLKTAHKYVSAYSGSRADKLFSGIDFSSDKDEIEAAEELLYLLLNFIYETVEASRRAAIREIWRWSQLENKDAVLRSRLIDYLQETEFSREVLEILRESEHDLERWHDLLEKLSSLRDIQELDAGLSRATEDFPDHPAILAMRSIVAAIKEKNDESLSFASGCINFLHKRYTDDPQLMLDYAGWILRHIPENDGLKSSVLFRITENDDGSICNLGYDTYSSHEDRLGAVPRLLSLLTDKFEHIINN